MSVFLFRIRILPVIIVFFAAGILHAQEAISNLPTLFIDTEDVPVNSKDYYVQGTLYVLSNNPSIKQDTLPMGIRGRGNSTWGMPKKPYRIKLNAEAHLLGMKANNRDWVLLSNYADKSLVRNALAFKISEWVGLEYTPEFRFVDVILNGEYLGNYTLCDQVEVANNRVPVEKQDIDMITLPAISGGYLVELDGFANREQVWFETDRGMKATVKYPDDDDINTQQLDYITDYIQNYEDILFSESFKDPDVGYRSVTDSASLINWYIASELSGNPDCFWSTNIYKKRLIDKLFFGPLWDNDISFNNDSRLGDATEKLMLDAAHQNKLWINRLYQDEWFVRAVGKRWEALEAAGILDSLLSYMNEVESLMFESQQQNFMRWDILPDKVYLEQFLFDTWEENIDFLKEYVTARVAFLDETLTDYPRGPFQIENYYYVIRNAGSGLVLDVKQDDEGELNMWEPIEDKVSQHFELSDLGDGTVRIINRLTGTSVRSNAQGEILSLTELNELNEHNNALKWTIESIGSNNRYGIVNKGTGFVIDNSGGGTSNGTKAIVWQNDIGSNVNQQWVFDKVESIPSGLRHVDPQIMLSVYPNPVKQLLYIKVNQPFNETLQANVRDLSGKVIKTGAIKGNAIDLSELNKGVYFVEISAGNYKQIFKIIKQ